MPRLVLKFGEVRKILLRNNFALDRQRGTSHQQYVKNDDSGNIVARVTVAGKDSDTVSRGTLKSIIRQSNMPKKIFSDFKKSKKRSRADAIEPFANNRET